MRTLQDVADHDAALTVSCNHCRAAAGEPCTAPDRYGVHRPLQNFPAHPGRVKLAGRIARLEALDADRAEVGQ